MEVATNFSGVMSSPHAGSKWNYQNSLLLHGQSQLRKYESSKKITACVRQGRTTSILRARSFFKTDQICSFASFSIFHTGSDFCQSLKRRRKIDVTRDILGPLEDRSKMISLQSRLLVITEFHFRILVTRRDAIGLHSYIGREYRSFEWML